MSASRVMSVLACLVVVGLVIAIAGAYASPTVYQTDFTTDPGWTTNNATNNYRFESGVIITDYFVVQKFAEQIDAMIRESSLYGGKNDTGAD